MAHSDARALAERHLAQQLPQRWLHVQSVAGEVARVCATLQFDNDAVKSAAWLHDLGYAPELFDTGFHPLDAARYLREEAWPDEVCRLVANHTDAIRQAELLGLGEMLRGEFPDDQGIGRDILWSADATTGPAGQRMTLSQRIAEISERYGADNFVSQCMVASQPELQAAIDRVDARLAKAGR